MLIREMMPYVSRAEDFQKRIDTTFSEAYAELRKANIVMGASTVEVIALAIPEAEDYNILYKSVMGVEIAHVTFEKKEIEPKYSFYSTSSAMDMAYKKFNEVKYLIYELAEVENAVYKRKKDSEKS